MLVVVPPERLHEHWEWVRKGLEHVRTKCDEPWHPSDIYKALHLGHAHLFTIGQEDGFIILRQQQSFGRTELFVWVIYAPGLFGGEPERQEKFWDELTIMARRIGAHQIVANSPLKGWVRGGFKIREYVYARDV